MVSSSQKSERVGGSGIEIETYVDGQGPAIVILPSYGRGSAGDFDDITDRLVGAGWKVLRPQPRGIKGSQGPMSGVTFHDLAGDVARCIRALSDGPAVLLGHAFGQALSRLVTTDHPQLVKAVILAAAEASHVPEEIAKTPFIAGDTSSPESDRLAALRTAFFAPNHDARIWLDGWYPETLKMQHSAAATVPSSEYWACGSVPLLELIGEYDPFIPKEYWQEMRGQFGERVTATVIKDASHALFPEQPDAVADAVTAWAARYHSG